MVLKLYICLFQNIMFAFMPEDDFGIKLKANKKLKKKNRNVLLNTMSPLYYCLMFAGGLMFCVQDASICEAMDSVSQHNYPSSEPRDSTTPLGESCNSAPDFNALFVT